MQTLGLTFQLLCVPGILEHPACGAETDAVSSSWFSRVSWLTCVPKTFTCGRSNPYYIHVTILGNKVFPALLTLRTGD